MWFKKLVVSLICNLIGTGILLGQDTVFVQKHTFDEAVVNIDSEGGSLMVRTATMVFILRAKGFEKLQGIDVSRGRYTWLRTSNKESGFATYNTDFIPATKMVTRIQIGEYLPGPFHPDITSGRSGRFFFVAYKGSILEYEVKDFYRLQHKGKSVRHVYNEDSLKITSTYSGIYLDTHYNRYAEKEVPGAGYSNGEVAKINNRYYLCRDYIFVLDGGKWRPLGPTMANPPYRKLLLRGERVFFLREDAVGTIDLADGSLIDTLFLSKDRLNDMKWVDGKCVVASEAGALYILDANGAVDTLRVGSGVYDINPSEKGVVLSCKDGVYRVDISQKKLEKLAKLDNAIQSIYAEGALLITTYSGLFVVHDEKLYNIIPKVEFNRYALSQWQDVVFAGSIEGLYVIDRGQLLHDIIPGLKPIIIEPANKVPYIFLLLIILVIVFVVLFFITRKRNKVLRVEVQKKIKVTPEKIKEAMLQNEKLISVESIAAHFHTSTVQLNRILNKQGTSGLALIKEIKKEMVSQMVDRGATLEEISIRLGYSKGYITRNFLNKN